MDGADVDKIKSGALKVQVKTETDHPALPHGSPHETFGMVELVAPKFEEENRRSRAPIDLVCVIDVSGSMSGDKISLVKNTLLFMVDQLKSEDRLSIISFSSNVNRLTQLSALTEQNKKAAKAAISAMHAGGGTNLSGGLLEGLQVLSERQMKNAVASCFLFTDGQPSTGIRDATSLLRVAKGVTDQIDAVVGVSTFGFGTDHDAALLRGIAEGSNGMFYYVASEEDISQAFADSLGGLLSVVAQNLDLVLVAAPDVTINELQVTYAFETQEPGKRYSFRLKDLYSEEKRDLVFRLHLNSSTSPIQSQMLVTATLSYFNVLTLAKESVEGVMTIARPATATIGDPNPNIEAQRNRIAVARAINVAIEAGKKGDYAAGQQAIEAVQAQIKASKCATAAHSTNLLKDLDEAKAELSNKSAYAGGGAQKMMSKVSAHEQQRSNLSSPMYSNACQMQQKSAYAQAIPSQVHSAPMMRTQQHLTPQAPQQPYMSNVMPQQHYVFNAMPQQAYMPNVMPQQAFLSNVAMSNVSNNVVVPRSAPPQQAHAPPRNLNDAPQEPPKST